MVISITRKALFFKKTFHCCFLATSVAFSTIILSGCGCFAIPYKIILPCESYRHVSVFDKETGKLIQDASVTFQVIKCTNWHPHKPILSSLNSDDNFIAFVGENPSQTVENICVKISNDGRFHMKEKIKYGWKQYWFPLPNPLGWTFYRTYVGRLVVGAHGYETIWLDDGLTASAINDEFPEFRDAVVIRSNETSIFLQKLSTAVP